MRVVAVTALCWLAHATMAFAQDEARRGPALHWVRLPGAESCITAAELAQRVEARLERGVFVLPQHAELAVEGHVRPRAEGGFVASLAVSNRAGVLLGARDLESPDADCRALDDALILITALTLFPGDLGMHSGGIALDDDTNARLHALFGEEPSELDPGTLPGPAPVETAPPDATPQREAVTGQATMKPRPPRTRFSIEGAPVLAFGVLPGVALAVSAHVSLRLARLWPMRLGVTHFFERSARAEALTTGMASFERNELNVFACPFAPDRPLALELCGGAVLGLVAVRSEGFVEGGIDATDPVVDVGGEAGVRALLFDLVLARASAMALLPLVQHSYEYQALDASTEQLFRSAQVSFRLQISAGLEF